MGLFCDDPIPAGTLIWRYEPKIDFRFTREEVEALPPAAKAFVLRFCYPVGDGWEVFEVNGDNMRFLNHSETPNVVYGDEDIVSTARDIAAGEELVSDYHGLYAPGTPAWVP